ncbi:MAG: RNA polymerase factor sigma-54 [Alphaproteobacteria bacterium]|nr:RNA polymerase factor sigma-54 [Alphaproteobacteria bacterium]
MEMRGSQALQQNLVMTPQLQQAIKLLQMSNIELSSYLETEMEKNPLLEKADDTSFDAAFENDAGEEIKDDGKIIAADKASDQGNYESTSEDSSDEGSWNLSSQSRSAGHDGRNEDAGEHESTLSHGVSLRDHLMGQMQLDVVDQRERMIALMLMDSLDEAGYMTADIKLMAEKLGCEVQKIEDVLLRLQKFEPVGIFARNLKECLALQLKEKGRFDPAMQAMVEHLDLLAAREKDKLMKLCGVDAEDFAEMVSEIRCLNPKPALAFDHDTAPTIIPDVLMRGSAAKGWVIELNQETLPRVLINESYLSKVQGQVIKKQEKDYLSERVQSANWLVRALHQRATTILKVASEIVRQQDMFFQHGVEFLKPMTLRDIASIIGMHESTVSRVTSNKYIATPRGMFELKYFFSVSINGCSGLSAHSAESVRHRIKALIEGETPNAVLSDEDLVKILKREGVEIARRTVAKYREAMHIATSAQRRREKRIKI